MKKVFLILTVAVLAVNVFSQSNKNQISFSMGESFAVGEFADKSISSDKAGGAGAGANLFFYYGHKFSNNWGLGVKWFGNSNKFDAEESINALYNTTGYRWTANSAYWSAGGFLLGLTAHIPSSEKFIIDLRLLGGYMTLNSPELIVSISGLSNAWVKMESASTASLGYNLGAGFSYYFNPKWNLLVNFDYISANFKFDDMVVTSSSEVSKHSYGVNQSLGLRNVTLGIGYNF